MKALALNNPVQDFINKVFALATIATNVARQKLAGALDGTTFTAPTYVAHGTGAGTSAVTDTTLFTESTTDGRTNGTASLVTTTVSNDTLQVVGTVTNLTGSSETITNAGLFDASTSGNMYMKGDFTGQALNAGDKIQYTMKFQIQ